MKPDVLEVLNRIDREYSMKASCQNCGHKWLAWFRKGRTASASGLTCPNCEVSGRIALSDK